MYKCAILCVYALILQLLRAYSICPTYDDLREADTKTQAYINLEKENKVRCNLVSVATATYVKAS